MEIQLQELIDQIKKDGVATAEAEAAAKIEEANTEATRILAEAKAEADRIVKAAQEENARLVRAGEDALRQAGRNLLISFRESVARELTVLTGEQVAALCTSDKLSTLILSVVEAIAKSGEEELTVLLNSADMAALEAGLLAALKERLLGGVTLRANDAFAGGFRVAVKDGAAYYDFSAEAVTEMLSAYLNPRVAALLKEAAV